MRRYVEKLVRGTVYFTEERYIESGTIGMSFIRTEDATDDVYQMLEQFGQLYELGAGIRFRKAVAAEAPEQPLFVFDIWGQFRVFAYVEDSGAQR